MDLHTAYVLTRVVEMCCWNVLLRLASVLPGQIPAIEVEDCLVVDRYLESY